jgi:hypothetical protein
MSTFDGNTKSMVLRDDKRENKKLLLCVQAELKENGMSDVIISCV